MIKTTSIILTFTAIVSWILYLFPNQMIAPGKLLEKHQHLQDNCTSCHEILQGPSSSKCAQCHIPEKIGVANADATQVMQRQKQLSFHAKLADTSCISCHQEHQGSFSAKQTMQFSHQLLGIQTTDSCQDCHQPPDDSIHQQTNQACLQCHTTTNWRSNNFNHDSYFRFDRNHPANCATCHPGTNFNDYSCFGCHEHSPQKIAREHLKEGINDYEDCAQCHPSGNDHETGKRNKRETLRTDRMSDHNQNPGLKVSPTSGQSLDSQRRTDNDEDDRDDDREDNKKDDHGRYHEKKEEHENDRGKKQKSRNKHD